MGRIDAGTYFDMCSATSFKYNWCYQEFLHRYGRTPAMENNPDVGKAKRLLVHRVFRQQSIICCSEDIICWKDHNRAEIRDCCLLPLCYTCLHISSKPAEEHCKIPRALANDNFYGYVDDTIVKYGVRWIELAAASPILNCIVCYYVEGDRGHLLDEKVFQREDPMNVRGNAYSFAMPWDTIAAKLSQVVEGEVDWSELPQNEELLARTVLFNLRIGNVDSGFVLPSKGVER